MPVVSMNPKAVSPPAEPAVVAAGRPTLFLRCPVCGGDEAEPLGVTDTMADAVPAAVILRCEACSAAWLSPPPAAAGAAVEQWSHQWSPGSRRLRRWTSNLPPVAELLMADESLADTPAARQYDLIVLPHSLESAVDPAAFLEEVASRLAPRGRAISITGNVDSSCFRSFGGRHWSGYRYPRARQLFCPEALERLCGDDGPLHIRRIESAFDSRYWLGSTRNWLRDWGAPGIVAALLTGPWGLPQAVAALVEGVANLRGRGALLLTELEKR